MHLFFFLTIVLASLCAYTAALPQLSSIFRRSEPIKRDNVTAYAYKYQKNCQKDNKASLEQADWDVYQQLATYAKKWKANGPYQTTADMWFGSDSAKNHDRIMSKWPHLLFLPLHSHCVQRTTTMPMNSMILGFGTHLANRRRHCTRFTALRTVQMEKFLSLITGTENAKANGLAVTAKKETGATVSSDPDGIGLMYALLPVPRSH